MAHICRRPILGILLLACPSAVSSGQSQPDTAQYDAVNDSFSLSVTEYLDPPFAGARDRGPSLYLRATTRRNSGCGGLGMSVRFSRRRVDVYLAGVPRRPGPCASDMGPATGIVRLPPQAGVYDLIIRRPDDQVVDSRLRRQADDAGSGPHITRTGPRTTRHASQVYVDTTS